VTILDRRDRDEMPADDREIADALAEGVRLDGGTGSATPAKGAVPAASPEPRKHVPPRPKPRVATPFPPDDLRPDCEALLSRYPEKAAALIPILHVAQRKFGWISPELEAGIAGYLGVSDAHVRGVVTFYTMFNMKPVGRHHLQVCRTLSCWLRGAGAITERIKEKTGLSPGETGKDGRFSVCEVECLGLCEAAPALLVNETALSNVTPDALDRLFDGLR
jgi:NADH-quinone oxidoreductase subunit E